LAQLSPADYINTETAYKQVLQQYGLPAGFYDSPSDLNDFIAKDVSPSELNTRAQAAQQVWLSNDDAAKDTWRSWYGLSDGAAIASILDPKTALPIVQRMAQPLNSVVTQLRQGLTPTSSGSSSTPIRATPGIRWTRGSRRSGRSGIRWQDRAAVRAGLLAGHALDANIGNNAAASNQRQSLD
jgi:hypothetical protein